MGIIHRYLRTEDFISRACHGWRVARSLGQSTSSWRVAYSLTEHQLLEGDLQLDRVPALGPLFPWVLGGLFCEAPR